MAVRLRSVKFILQNSSSDMLTIEGFSTIRGDWDTAPKQGDIVEAQSTMQWMTYSVSLSVGTGAYIRLGTGKGYIITTWNRPWTGKFTNSTTIPDHLAVKVDVNEEDPDHVVMVVTIKESASIAKKSTDKG